MNTFQVGEKVLFGRRNGERTKGTILKVNRASILIRQDEERGSLRSHEVGTRWKVHPNLCYKLEPSAPQTVSSDAAIRRRTDREILLEILGNYAVLNSEALYRDGMASAASVRRGKSMIRASLSSLFAELGRSVTEAQARRELMAAK